MRSSLERLAAGWAIGGGIVVLLITGVTTTNVGAFALDRIARLFDANVGALPGYEDFVRLAVSCAALMFFPYCQAKRGHITIDLFARAIPRPLRRLIDGAWLLGTAALALFLCYWMTLGMRETLNDGVLSRVLGWPEWPFYLPGIVSLLLWAAVAASQVLEERADG